MVSDPAQSRSDEYPEMDRSETPEGVAMAASDVKVAVDSTSVATPATEVEVLTFLLAIEVVLVKVLTLLVFVALTFLLVVVVALTFLVVVGETSTQAFVAAAERL